MRAENKNRNKAKTTKRKEKTKQKQRENNNRKQMPAIIHNNTKYTDVLVANPEKTTFLHGGQFRSSWSAEQGENKKKSGSAPPPPPPTLPV